MFAMKDLSKHRYRQIASIWPILLLSQAPFVEHCGSIKLYTIIILSVIGVFFNFITLIGEYVHLFVDMKIYTQIFNPSSNFY